MNVCPDDFYPRAYDLGEKIDVEDFIEDFKTSKAISLLRKCKELNGINVNKRLKIKDNNCNMQVVPNILFKTFKKTTIFGCIISH